ncbi:MAG TPA: hypothetical protein VFY39_03885 [Gammaproteobacteria bacterium]|nr:hypothetical protein [Gammaproteobacteria bacterium]
MRFVVLAAAVRLSIGFLNPSFAQRRTAKLPPAGPAPRGPDGRVLLGGANPSQKGVWVPSKVIVKPLIPLDQIPFEPWARAQYDSRQATRMEPHTRCKPSGSARQFLTPYGVEIDEFRQLKRVYIFDIGGPHTFRTVYMDGRSHPRDFDPTYYGHSIGWWEGDTLVIDTVGYNEGFWPDRMGLPHTTQLHTVERLTRLDSRTMNYEITFEDAGAYTAPWTAGFTLRWENGTELYEYVCQDANEAAQLLVGENGTSVDRTSRIAP